MSDPKENAPSQVDEQLADSKLEAVSGGEKSVAPGASAEPGETEESDAGEAGAGEKGFFKFKKKKFFHGHHH